MSNSYSSKGTVYDMKDRPATFDLTLTNRAGGYSVRGWVETADGEMLEVVDGGSPELTSQEEANNRATLHAQNRVEQA